jgi:hypothetical protein
MCWSLEDWGNFGNAITALIGLPALVFLAVQTWQNRRTLNSANLQNAALSFNAVNTAVGVDPKVAEIVLRGVEDPGSLDKVAQSQYVCIQRAYFNCYWFLFEQSQKGALSKDQWDPYAREVRQLLTMPGPKLFRKNNRMYEEMFLHAEKIEGSSPVSVSLHFSTGPDGVAGPRSPAPPSGS